MSDDDETRPVRVHKIEVLVIDFDDVGADGVREVIETARYPNRCINPRVQRVETREVEWSDDHPLNLAASCDDAYRELFRVGPSDG